MARRTAPQIHLVTEPASGQVVELPAGSHLEVSFRRRGLTSSWHVEQLPGHLLPLAAGANEFQFFVFDAPVQPEPTRLRLVRSCPGRDEPNEVRELTVLTRHGR